MRLRLKLRGFNYGVRGFTEAEQMKKTTSAPTQPTKLETQPTKLGTQPAKLGTQPAQLDRDLDVGFQPSGFATALFLKDTKTPALFLKDTKKPLKGSRGVENNPRRFIHRTVGLEDVKLIKNAINNTINDVVVGVTQAALSRYLNRRYGEIMKEKGAMEKKNYLPKNFRLRATFFINIRPFVGIHALFDMMKKGTKVRWGNTIGYVLLPFTIALLDDPLDYVREAKSVIDKKKASIEPVCTYRITKLIIKFFGIKAAGVLNYKVFSNTTLWFSNVPGPQEEIAFCGHSMAYFAPSCFGQPNALMIHVVSYIDKLTFMISADEGTIPDPQQLCDDLEHSLNLIKSAVLAKDRSVLHQE
ncbi:wax ester synthase/diacylglycerol acyltransferase 5-like [Cornus florida]|uniref:wax ester synthase/diacylglycerol acyltransferase 5-like n=1 Tax=Cornus florida TaxID=4283 RepID=UPI00289BBE20|nr:wax ester synthase/diacylglycerol acyltransferase 5-like [Cornus florida]